MVLSSRRDEDVESSNSQAQELPSVDDQNAEENLKYSTQQVPAYSAPTVFPGSKVLKRQADEGLIPEESNFRPKSPRPGRPEIADLRCNLDHGNVGTQRGTSSCGLTTLLGSRSSLTTAASLTLSSNLVPSSVLFPPRAYAQPTINSPVEPDAGNPARNNAERCQVSALGRAGNTGSIDVVSRSGLACQIRSNSMQNSTTLGRLSVEAQSVEHNSRQSSSETSQEPSRESAQDSERESTEEQNRGSGALQWVQALGFQGTGACRADERLRPLLRWNVSCVGGYGRLLLQLGQHFKARELNLLARCLCAPLVHIRVGKVLRQGCVLRPTSSRGFLSLVMSPGSELRLSFTPDTGFVEMLATIDLGSGAPLVSLEQLSADSSGRTFMLKFPDSKLLYFWQSEKAKATGDELVLKMKDILEQRPTLSKLTGIDESRLDSFASYICSALTAASSTELSQSHASASFTASPHTCTVTNSGPSTLPSSSPASALFNGEPQSVSLPPAFTSSRVTLEGDGSARPVSRSRNLSQSAPSCENKPAFSLLARSSSASWHDTDSRCQLTSDSTGVSLFGPSSSYSVASDNCVANTHDQSLSLVSSWSTRTSLSGSNPGKVQSPSLSAGLFTSFNLDTSGPRDDTFEIQSRAAIQTVSDLPRTSSVHSYYPSFLEESATYRRSFSPPVSAHISTPTAARLAPYHCTCPLSNFTPPYVPTTSEGGLLSPSAPFFSVRPPPSLFPPGSLSFHEFSLSPVQLPVSTLVTAAIPIHSSGISPLYTQPVTSIPILHMPNPYLVRTSSAVSGYSTTPCESAEKSFFSSTRSRQSIYGESFSVNLSTSSCPGVSGWQSPNKFEAFMHATDPSLSSNAPTSSVKSSPDTVKQTQRPLVDRNLVGTPGFTGSFGLGLHTTYRPWTDRERELGSFELGSHYDPWEYVSHIHEDSSRETSDRMSAVPVCNFEHMTSITDMRGPSNTCCMPGQTRLSSKSWSTEGGSRTGESTTSARSGSAEDVTDATVKNMAAKNSKHTDETIEMDANKKT